jgi:intracellular sulfur oxidation DsrE/DsrF family protein
VKNIICQMAVPVRAGCGDDIDTTTLRMKIMKRPNPAASVTASLLLMLVSLFISVAPAWATEAKPFAEKHVVLQISDPDPFKQTLVLNVANNLLKHYGPDRVEVELVAFGPGLRLLMADNDNSSRIDGLTAQGVRFSACENTIASFTKKLGKAPALNPHAVPVTAGVVRIMDLVDQGFLLIRP